MFHKILNEDCTVKVGDKTIIGENVVLGPNCKKITIGFGCFIGRDIYIDVEELTIGDYTTIHHGAIVHGIKTAIGHNCWFGHYTIIDSLGGNTVIHNNVGVGAHSQLWSHMKFGDTLAGCRWNSSGSLVLEDDVWLVGHSIVGPIHAKSRAMLMTGGVATRNMEENRIYAGSPASDITEKLGQQFTDVSLEERRAKFEQLKQDFAHKSGIDVGQFVAVETFSEESSVTEFELMGRKYRPRRTDDEYKFIKFMLYDKAKFVPVE
jgi:acetyltransferase-like isoleucine patch superfamily enzyme